MDAEHTVMSNNNSNKDKGEKSNCRVYKKRKANRAHDKSQQQKIELKAEVDKLSEAFETIKKDLKAVKERLEKGRTRSICKTKQNSAWIEYECKKGKRKQTIKEDWIKQEVQKNTEGEMKQTQYKQKKKTNGTWVGT